jgi:hypothetical protein
VRAEAVLDELLARGLLLDDDRDLPERIPVRGRDGRERAVDQALERRRAGSRSGGAPW